MCPSGPTVLKGSLCGCLLLACAIRREGEGSAWLEAEGLILPSVLVHAHFPACRVDHPHTNQLEPLPSATEQRSNKQTPGLWRPQSSFPARSRKTHHQLTQGSHLSLTKAEAKSSNRPELGTAPGN